MRFNSKWFSMPVKDKYRSIRLPEEMIARIEALIKEHPEHGFKSKAEVIKIAIRALLKELEDTKE